MAKTAREQLAELETGYKAKKKDLAGKVKAEEAKELAGLFDTTLNEAVEALRASVTSGLGVYHRNLKAVVVRVSVDGKGVTTVKNTIRTIRMTPKEIEAWDASHVEPSREDMAVEMRNAITDSVTVLDEYEEETIRLEVETQASESETPETSETPVESEKEPAVA